MSAAEIVPSVLLVEDNAADIALLVQAFRESSFKHHLHVAKSGTQALTYLRQKTPPVRSPDLIILDLNMPGKNGRAVLAEIKRDIKLRNIPIIILSMSQSQDDVLMSYQHNANCYITKPIDYDEFITVVKKIKEFWIDTVKLPNSMASLH